MKTKLVKKYKKWGTLSEEKMPIILDEAFAYYDDNRLENILKYLTLIFVSFLVLLLLNL